MRKGFEGLHGLVRDHRGQDPLSGHLFLFTNKTKTRLKALVWDDSGLWVCAEGRFRPCIGHLATSYASVALLVYPPALLPICRLCAVAQTIALCRLRALPEEHPVDHSVDTRRPSDTQLHVAGHIPDQIHAAAEARYASAVENCIRVGIQHI